jgi:hypothetical protein
MAEVPETKDVGLVILEQPIMLEEYARLAAPGTLDALATRRGQQETTFTVSGYGIRRPTRFPTPRSGSGSWPSPS